MSMEISSYYKDYKNDFLEEMQEGQNKIKETGKEQNTGIKSESSLIPKDEYISSEKSGSRPSGLYRMGRDENGNPKVLFDDPKKSDSAAGNGQPTAKSESPENDPQKCITNTDKVDREIRNLKEQKKQLKQQIKAASGDEEKIQELEKKLSRIESELYQKDNDTYRRQNASVLGDGAGIGQNR